MKKKKWILFSFFALIITAVAALYALRPDLRFLTVQALQTPFRNVRLAQTAVPDSSLRSVSIEELQDTESLTAYDQSLMLINEDYPLKENFSPSLSAYQDTGYQLNSCMVKQFEALSAAVSAKTGSTLYITSAARTYREQVEIKEEQPDTAADPGESEHESGLAVDICTDGFAGSAFLKSAAGQYVYEYGWRYGFILRYPLGKNSITGIPFEPWHIRYVGRPHAYIMYQNNLTLEEYIHALEPGKFYSSCGYLISRQKEGDSLHIPQNASNIHISSDNTGHYIITCRIAA